MQVVCIPHEHLLSMIVQSLSSVLFPCCLLSFAAASVAHCTLRVLLEEK
jgi:hypothetical protein